MFLAFAAEAAAEAAEGKKTFPPFDASLFPHQLFWFVLSFVALYAIMAKVALPRIAAVIAARDAQVKSDIDAAAKASAQAEEARKAAEAGAAAARTKAREMIDGMRAEAIAGFAAEQAKVEKALSARGVAAEKRIAETRAKAMAEVGPIAADLAKDIAARVTGGAVGSLAV
jgi:F-type H+-transporting ATPase subunit b